MALATLSKYAAKLKAYLNIWKESGKQYNSIHPDNSIRGTDFSAGLTDLVSHELNASVLTISAETSTTASLSWTAVTAKTGSTTYDWYRSTNPKKDFVKVGADVSSTTTTASGLTPGTTYYFYVVAKNSSDANVISSTSNTISARTLSSLPATASISGTGGTGSAVITWTAVSFATGYVLDRSTTIDFSAGNTLGIYTGALLTFTDTITTGTYYYRVTPTATGYTGTSKISSAVVVA